MQPPRESQSMFKGFHCLFVDQMKMRGGVEHHLHIGDKLPGDLIPERLITSSSGFMWMLSNTGTRWNPVWPHQLRAMVSCSNFWDISQERNGITIKQSLLLPYRKVIQKDIMVDGSERFGEIEKDQQGHNCGLGFQAGENLLNVSLGNQSRWKRWRGGSPGCVKKVSIKVDYKAFIVKYTTSSFIGGGGRTQHPARHLCLLTQTRHLYAGHSWMSSILGSNVEQHEQTNG